ncbi:MAG: alanine racemase [Xanthomonadales bacterium]|nr:alanine racemase [Xanthomonadales bacterium]
MRPARALVDLSALRHNYRLARKLGGQRALAVVKADAYGHGAVRCAQALEAVADGFAVACIEEALALRAAGIRAPILLLEGFFDAAELALIDAHDLWCAIQADWQLEVLAQARLQHPLDVWLLLDSGMHRLGFAPEAWQAAAQRLRDMPQVRNVVAMTHFARADELDSRRTEEQLAVFRQAGSALALPASVGNSAAVLGWPGANGDWARPGLMLYGVNPFGAPHPLADQLQAVMTLESAVISVRGIAVGEPVGYGAHFVARRPTRVGIVALGYADGYPQLAPNGTPVAIDGRPGELIGRVSMDMLAIDLTDHPAAGLGSRVELWGAQIPVTGVARHAGRTAYDLLCGVKRVPLVYLDA